MPTISVEMNAKEGKLVAAILGAARSMEKLESETTDVGKASRKAAAEEAKLGREAKRVYEQTRTPMEAHKNRLNQLSKMVKTGKIDQQTYGRAVAASQKQLTEAGSAGERAFGKIGQAIVPVLGALGVGGGIVGGLSKISEGYKVWLQNMEEVSAKTAELTKSYLAFAVLQEGGTKAKRVQEAGALAQKYGITNLGQAYDVAQAMQSTRGSFAAGMKTTESVFAASQIGIPVEAGKEVKIKKGVGGIGEKGIGNVPIESADISHSQDHRLHGSLSGRGLYLTTEVDVTGNPRR